MKAILEFNLPDDQIEFNRANQSLDMACALFDILQLRKAMERRFENINNTNNDIINVTQNNIISPYFQKFLLCK